MDAGVINRIANKQKQTCILLNYPIKTVNGGKALEICNRNSMLATSCDWQLDIRRNNRKSFLIAHSVSNYGARTMSKCFTAGTIQFSFVNHELVGQVLN